MTHTSKFRSTRLPLVLFTALTLIGFTGLLQTTQPLAGSLAAQQSPVTPQASGSAAGTSVTGSQKQADKKQAAKKQSDKKQATVFQLREVRRGVFESPAGLLYLPGSEEGHRIDHVMQHLADNPRKKLHGVFEGDRNRWLATIDEAWQKSATGGPLVRRQQQNNRTVTTVNLQRRLGYVGGSEGAGKRNPECRMVRIVTENRREVITAYPVQAF